MSIQGGRKQCKYPSVSMQVYCKYASVSMKTFTGDILMKNIPPLSKFSLKAEGGTNSVNQKCNPLRRSCVSSAQNAGESAICPVRATLCGDRACKEVKNLQNKGVPARQRDIQRETHTHTQRPTHCLNTLDLRLHTEHLTHNSHSNFTRGEKCFRATRRLVFFRDPCTPALRWVRPLAGWNGARIQPQKLPKV